MINSCFSSLLNDESFPSPIKIKEYDHTVPFGYIISSIVGEFCCLVGLTDNKTINRQNKYCDYS